MRKSRLYLALSVLSLVFGVALGHAQQRCDGRQHECPFGLNDFGHGGECREEIATPAEAASLRRETLRMVQTGDYDTMQQNAEYLVAIEPDNAFHHEMLGYALRGRQMHRTSNLSYERALKLALADEVANAPIICDSHIAMAANYQALGERENALESIGAALRLAEQNRRAYQDEAAYYQLACALAVRSTIREGRPALVDRGSALANLRFAIEKGFDGWDHMQGDLDLEALHGYAPFEELFPDGRFSRPEASQTRAD